MATPRLSFPNLMAKLITPVDAEYHRDIHKAHRELRARISSDIHCAPHILRLALDDAGTCNAEEKIVGPKGSIKNEAEAAKYGLETAFKLCEDVKAKYPKVSYADIYQLAGVVAVEVTGGPTIDFVPGRQDNSEAPKPKGLLPDANLDASHLRKVFHGMGLTDKDTVALWGGYTWAKEKGSGSQVLLTKDHLKFDNSYFKQLKLGRGKALVDDPEFHKYVVKYAEDEDAFFSDYAASHKKLSELGFHKHANMVTHGVIGIFIASTVVMLGYIFEVNRRSN